MEHVVFFPAHDGSPAFRRVASLEDAVRLVEHLRNVEGVNEVSCHALTEVPLAFRAYYRVELPTEASHESAPEPAAALPEQSVPEQPVAEHARAEQAVPTVVEDVAVEPAPAVEPDAAAEPVLASANGRSHDGAKSLGFFA